MMDYRIAFRMLLTWTCLLPLTLVAGCMFVVQMPKETPFSPSNALQPLNQEPHYNSVVETNRELDLWIEGPGFFQIQGMDENETLYTPVGYFKLNSSGQILTAGSDFDRLLEPTITIPMDATELRVAADGLVSVRQPGSDEKVMLGQIQLVGFVNPTGLKRISENVYMESDASGSPVISSPGQNGLGTIRQHHMQQSVIARRGDIPDFSQKTFDSTERPLDVAIAGPGFLQLEDNERNEILYTRIGNLSRNADGQLTHSRGHVERMLEPAITIPQDAVDLSISADGIVSVRQPGNTEAVQIGQIQLVRFVNPEGLIEVADKIYAETEASGSPMIAAPGQEGMGKIRSGTLEILE